MILCGLLLSRIIMSLIALEYKASKQPWSEENCVELVILSWWSTLAYFSRFFLHNWLMWNIQLVTLSSTNSKTTLVCNISWRLHASEYILSRTEVIIFYQAKNFERMRQEHHDELNSNLKSHHLNALEANFCLSLWFYGTKKVWNCQLWKETHRSTTW